MPTPTGFDEEDRGDWKAHRATLLQAPNKEQLFGWVFPLIIHERSRFEHVARKASLSTRICLMKAP